MRFFGKGKSICIKFACLSYHSFRSSQRKVVSTPPLPGDFTQQSSLRSSHGPLRKTNLCQAFLQQEVSHRFMFTHKTNCLFNCSLYGIGILFNPNNLKRKARCASDLLEYIQVNKIMQKLRKKKDLATNYKTSLVRFFTILKHRFIERSVVYNFCPHENKSFNRISYVSKH